MQSPPYPILSTKNLTELSDRHWTLIASLPETDLQSLITQAQGLWKQGLFRPAAIGRGAEQERRELVRSDSIYWLKTPSEIPGFLRDLQLELNRSLYLGIDALECHFAHYAPGQFYQEHLDQPKAQSFLHGERLVSFVLYLNPHWQISDGGQLQIRNTRKDLPPLEIVEPRWGQLVLFKSDTVLHQVLPSQSERWSLTGWFRRT